MECTDKLKELLTASRNYYNHLEKCSKSWNEISQIARVRERDLLTLSDQLRCLLMQDQTKLSALEVQKTSDRILLNMEHKFSNLFSLVNCVLKSQEELTTLRHSIENLSLPLEETNAVQSLLKTIYVSWLLFQTRSSSVGAAMYTINYNSPETIRHFLQCVVESEENKTELQDTLEIAENRLSALELLLHSSLKQESYEKT